MSGVVQVFAVLLFLFWGKNIATRVGNVSFTVPVTVPPTGDTKPSECKGKYVRLTAMTRYLNMHQVNLFV